MSSLSDRQIKILEFIVDSLHEHGFPPTIREICKKVGISSTSVTNYNLDKLEDQGLIMRRREVSRGLTVNWDAVAKFGLANGHGDTPTNGHPTGADDSDGGLFKVPVLGHIAAGEPIQVTPSDRHNTDKWVDLASGMFGDPDKLFALEVQGDSMIDASVLDGDIVILKHQETAENGDMVAAWIEGDEETTLKFLYKEGAQVRLEPANPKYDPILRDADKVRINGKVVSVMRYLN